MEAEESKLRRTQTVDDSSHWLLDLGLGVVGGPLEGGVPPRWRRGMGGRTAGAEGGPHSSAVRSQDEGVTRLTLHAGGGVRKQASYCHSPGKGGRSGPEERWAQAKLTCRSWTAPACFNTPEPCWEPPHPPKSCRLASFEVHDL